MNLARPKRILIFNTIGCARILRYETISQKKLGRFETA